MADQTSSLDFGYYESLVGRLLVAGTKDTLHMISFPSGSKAKAPTESWTRNDSSFREVYRQLDAYFAKELKQFDLKLSFKGTAFQNSVWNALCEIPFGITASYSEIANKIGRPKACRAVGAANGANPIPIVVPCHRVIGSNNSLTGFGGGLETKRFLLEHENGLPEFSNLF